MDNIIYPIFIIFYDMFISENNNLLQIYFKICHVQKEV